MNRLPSQKVDPIQAFRNRLSNLSLGSPSDKLLGSLILLNFLVVYFRPQNDLKVLESIKLPFIISLLPAFATLLKISKPWSRQLKMMALLMIQGAILVPLAVNGFWAFQGVRALFQMGYGLAFPIAFYFINTRNLVRFYKCFFLAGGYIAFYCLTHGGHGPGDFLGDENDACLVLVIILAPALFFITSKYSNLNKLILAPLIILMLAGVVAASSRGGFLGLLCVGAYVFYRSRQKFALIIVMMVISIIGAFSVPKAYWEDIGTISTTDATAQERFTYWGVAWRMFLDPPNFIAGVGMMNFPWRSGEYEAIENKGPHGKSMAGRQVHSLYFEALPELGIIGCYFLIVAVIASLRPSVKLNKTVYKEIRKLTAKSEGIPPDILLLRRAVAKEGEFAQLSLIAINACFIGMLSGGAFISVLYYPTFWLLLGLSSATQTYTRRWLDLSKSLLEFDHKQALTLPGASQ